MARLQTNKQRREIQDVPFAAGQTRESPLLRGVALTGLLLRISGTLNVSDNTTDASLNDFGIAKLLSRVQVLRDGESVVDARGDQLFTFQRPFLSTQGPELTQPDGTTPGNAITGNGDMDFAASIFIPFMPRGLLSNAFKLCHWPALVNIGQQFDLVVEWEDATANANSDAGTGAIADGGDDALTFSTEPSVSGVLFYNDKANPLSAQGSPRFPAFAPRIRGGLVSDRWDADTDEIRLSITSQFPILYLHLREQEDTGTTSTLEEMIQRLELTHEDDEIREMARALAFEEQAQDFSAVDRDLVGSASGTGELFYNFAEDGKIGGVLQPSDLTDPRFVFDVAVPPGGGEGRVEGVRYELTQIRGATAGAP